MQIFITFLYKIQFSNYDKRKNLRCLFFFFLAMPHGLWDLSSLIRY